MMSDLDREVNRRRSSTSEGVGPQQGDEGSHERDVGVEQFAFRGMLDVSRGDDASMIHRRNYGRWK